MLSVPLVVSGDPALETAMLDWLTASRMEFPSGFRIRVAVLDSIGRWEDDREVFGQGDVDIRAGGAAGWVHLTWRAAPARARIEADRPEVFIEISREATAQTDSFLRSFFLVALIFAWKRAGHFHVHAGTAIDPSGRGWMLVGNSCSGKSTTTALLAVRGWQVGTDDIAFLTADEQRAAVVGFGSPIALRSGGVELLGRAGGTRMVERLKTGFWPEELGTQWVRTVVPEIVVFTSVGGDRTTLVPMSPSEIIAQLMQWSLWVMFEPTGAQEHLDLLAQLARQARCFRATLAPDLFSAPGALGDFLP